MPENPLRKLEAYGQSIWMDFIRRGTISSGELKKWIDEDGVSGVTSNPSIFEKAIGGSHDYDHAIHSLAVQGVSVDEIYQAVTVEDIQRAADLFRPQYDRLDGKDGFVSIEVSPHLAHDTEGTIAEAQRLWDAVNRPNLMVKVPATRAGIPAIRKLIADGLNINITLLFGLPRYREVIEAYLSGLADRVDRDQSVERIASVASFFLSRIDVLVDPLLEKIIQASGEKSELAQRLKGQMAIASAKVAYRIFQEQFTSPRFQKLAAHGARPQRLLWASTSTKNPAYSDVKYVEALIGPQTINTITVETLDAYRDHGKPEPHLTEDIDQAQELLDLLPQLGIDLDAVTQQLEDEGVAKFNKSFDQLMQTLQEKSSAALREPLNR